MDPSERRAGATPGADRAEQEAYWARHAGGITPKQAARIAEEILAEDAPPTGTLPRARFSGVPQAYGDPRSY